MRRIISCPLSLALLLVFSTGCAGVGRRMVEGHYARQFEKAELTLKEVSAAGHQIAYVEGGNPEGETVVLVHGFAADKSNWYAFARFLVGDFHVYALDLPPFGESPEVPGTRYTVAGHADRLAAFLDAVDAPSAHLVGNSMGGHTVALFALAHPERVRTLALFDSAGVTSPKKSEMQRLGEEGINPFAVESRKDLDRMLALAFEDPPFLPRCAKTYLVEGYRARAAQTKKLLVDYQETWEPLEPDLPRITAPTLVLWGDKDRITDPSSVRVFVAGLPNETVVILEDCGHAPMIERPEETAERYLEFLKAAKMMPAPASATDSPAASEATDAG